MGWRWKGYARDRNSLPVSLIIAFFSPRRTSAARALTSFGYAPFCLNYDSNLLHSSPSSIFLIIQVEVSHPPTPPPASSLESRLSCQANDFPNSWNLSALVRLTVMMSNVTFTVIYSYWIPPTSWFKINFAFKPCTKRLGLIIFEYAELYVHNRVFNCDYILCVALLSDSPETVLVIQYRILGWMLIMNYMIKEGAIVRPSNLIWWYAKISSDVMKSTLMVHKYWVSYKLLKSAARRNNQIKKMRKCTIHRYTHIDTGRLINNLTKWSPSSKLSLSVHIFKNYSYIILQSTLGFAQQPSLYMPSKQCTFMFFSHARTHTLKYRRS